MSCFRCNNSGRAGSAPFPRCPVCNGSGDADNPAHPSCVHGSPPCLACDLVEPKRIEMLACAVSDDWATWRGAYPEEYEAAEAHRHRSNLDALELATRGNPFRKVKP